MPAVAHDDLRELETVHSGVADGWIARNRQQQDLIGPGHKWSQKEEEQVRQRQKTQAVVETANIPKEKVDVSRA